MKKNSASIKKAYNRIAPYYDAMEWFMELTLFDRLREILWQKVEGESILEIGVGTGKNLSYYPSGKKITAIDFSDQMLEQAKYKTKKLHFPVDLRLMDVQELDFADSSFDTVIATFVFCSVSDPVQGLKEILRVCKPGGQVLLLEHVLSSKPLLTAIMNFLNPLAVSIFGANINRRTVETVENSGFIDVKTDEKVSGDIVKLIEACKPA